MPACYYIQKLLNNQHQTEQLSTFFSSPDYSQTIKARMVQCGWLEARGVYLLYAKNFVYNDLES